MHEAPLPLAEGETLRLRVFLNRSSVEVFAQDGRVVLTDRVYADAASVGRRPRGPGRRARLVALRSWRLAR